MQDLRITLIQTALFWENPEANRNLFLKHFEQIKEPSDLIVLPEMFPTGFSMQPEKLSETMDGSSITWMKEQANRLNTTIVGSLIIQEKGHFYNRLIWMRPDATFATYDKKHLFSMGEEDKHYSAGKERLVVELKGWKVCPQVCYDLRFPAWNRNQNDYDLLLFIANWPERRSFAWKKLLQARAIENQAYVIGLNRVGNDGNDISHSGDSAIIDPLGEIAFTQADIPFVKTFTLSGKRLQFVRKKFPFLKDADEFDINNRDD